MQKADSCMNILISRTDSIGDVVLTLPMAGYLKERFPDCKVFFLGRTYTSAIIGMSKHVDQFLNWDEISKLPFDAQKGLLKSLSIDWIVHVYPNRDIARLAKAAKIQGRIGTSHRQFHWFTCNYKLSFSRKKSDLHESELNFNLLKPLGIDSGPKSDEMHRYYGLDVNRIKENSELPIKLTEGKKILILHPKSKGSAREWGLENFSQLIRLVNKEDYCICISGTADDREKMAGWLESLRTEVVDITGKLSLGQFIVFISRAHALVAASTGPLHIAAALGIKALGIYPPIRPMNPGRWRPIGIHASVLVVDKECQACRKSIECACIKAIRPEDVIRFLES